MRTSNRSPMTDRECSSRPRGALLAAIVMVLAVGVSSAEDRDSREVSDRWGIRVGYVGTETTTDLAAGTVLGGLVRIEDVLGFDENDQAIGLDGFYRFGAKKKGKHSLVFRFVDSRRDASGTVSASVPIFDETFVGSFASEYDVQTLGLAYRFSLIRTERAEAGILAGLSVLDYSFKLSGAIDDGSGGQIQDQASTDVLAPLPTFGFFIKYAVTPNLIFDVGSDALDIAVGDVEGRVLNTNARLTWYFMRHLGVGFGLGSTDVEVTDTSQNDQFKLDYRQNTATLSLSAVF